MDEKKEEINKTFTSNYDRAIKLHIHNSEVAERAVGVFLIAETVILGFLGNGFFESCCCNPQIPKYEWLLFGGSVFGLLLIIPWWASYNYRINFSDFWHAQMRRYEKKDGTDADTDAVAGHFEKDSNTLSKEGKVAIIINKKEEEVETICLGCFVMKVRHAYRFMMGLFALAFAGLAIASFIEILNKY